MRIIIDNKIRVKGFTPDMLQWCKSNLVIDNPDYHKKKSMGFSTWNIPSSIVLYEQDGEDLLLPFGCIQNLYAKFGSEHQFESQIIDLRPVSYKSSISLYGYQENAVNRAISMKNGVIVMPCGSGKTQTALEIIARIGGKALWLTHTQDLLTQSMNRAKAVYDIDHRTFGTITGGKVNIGTSITFATVQTMSKIDLTDYKDSFDIIIVDECHRAIGSPTKCMQFYKVLSKLSARYKFGLTATPKRADKLERCMYGLLGNKICEVDKACVKDTTVPVEVNKIETGYTPDIEMVLSGDGTLQYGKLVEDLINNKERNELILETINNLDGSILVLSSRVAHLESLDKNYKGNSICLSSLGTSKKAKAIRKNALRKLNNGELDCVFATYSLAKEGLDVPDLRYVVFATPEKDPTTVTQSAGRVGRKYQGKEFGTVVDFVDDFGMYRGWSKKRDRIYKKLDFSY